jgi:AcrR family transcriptional regulator
MLIERSFNMLIHNDERQQERRDATRKRLLETSRLLFARDGYAETSVKAIAREAGVAQGLLYHYFESKEQLIQAIFAETMAQVQESFAAGNYQTGGTAEERLERIIRRSFALVRANRDFWRLTYALRFQTAVLAGLAPLMSGWITEIRETFAALFTEMGISDAATLALLLFAQIDGVSQHYVLEPETYPLDSAQEEIIRRFCIAENREAR